MAAPAFTLHAPFGSKIRFAEPAWYQGKPTSIYGDSHVVLREKVRRFIETEVEPFVEQWHSAPEKLYPLSLHRRLFELGIVHAVLRVPQHLNGLSAAQNRTLPKFDVTHEVVVFDEIARISIPGTLEQLSINSMALPPVLMGASEELKRRVVPAVVRGEKTIVLAISEPGAGSDVANIRTTAVSDGDHFVVNGSKKWITGGLWADYITLAVKTGMGLTLLLVETSTLPDKSLTRRRMPTQSDGLMPVTFLTFDGVRVPKTNLIGEEGAGFKYLVHNFNHERLVIAVQALRGARLAYELSFRHMLRRKTFGKPLMAHQGLRLKLAEMARQIESGWAHVEAVASLFAAGCRDRDMGEDCALLKVNASRVFELCAREASQVFGGSAVVREGPGKEVERLYRGVRATAIPGGSEEVLLDFAIRRTSKLASLALAESEANSRL